MDAVDEFQEADILWPDTEDDELVPFAPVVEAAGSVPGLAPVFGRRFVEGFFLSAAAAGRTSLSAGSRPDAGDDEEWQEADVLWPDTADVSREGGGGSLWLFPGCSGRHLKPAAARRDGWRTGPAASSPIDIPANGAARRRF